MALAAFSSPLPGARESGKRAAAGGASNYTPGSARGFQRHAQRLGERLQALEPPGALIPPPAGVRLRPLPIGHGERLAPPGADRGCLMGLPVHRPAPFKLPGRAGVVSACKHWSLPRGVAALAPPGLCVKSCPRSEGRGTAAPPLSLGYASLTGTVKSKMSLGFCSSRYSAARVSMTSNMRPLSPATEAS